MVIIFSPITSIPEIQHVGRTILCEEYESIVKEAEESNKWVQKYLFATDLSGEAQPALEWTTGTAPREGDTPMAIHATNHDMVGDGGKTALDDRIAGELSSEAAALGSSPAAMNMPHTLSVPNRPVRTPGPWRPIVPSVPGRVGKDGWARRPSFVNTAGL